MPIDRRLKGFDAQRDHEAALADVGTPSPTSTYVEGAESLHFYKGIRRLPISPLRKQLLKEERFNPRQAGDQVVDQCGRLACSHALWGVCWMARPDPIACFRISG